MGLGCGGVGGGGGGGGGGAIVHGPSVPASFSQPSPEVRKNKLATGVSASTAKSRNKGSDNMLTSSGGSRPFLSGTGGGGVSRRLQ